MLQRAKHIREDNTAVNAARNGMSEDTGLNFLQSGTGGG